ncbi:MAG: hypothetical protein HC896_09575 [Bacteroidales bacterium]|nr:hypothetical protein [Bacteroidales bacterium]
MKHEGRISASGNFAESLAAMLGGLLAAQSVRLPYLAQIAVAFMAIPASIMLVSPVSHKITAAPVF